MLKVLALLPGSKIKLTEIKLEINLLTDSICSIGQCNTALYVRGVSDEFSRCEMCKSFAGTECDTSFCDTAGVSMYRRECRTQGAKQHCL